MKKQTEAIHQVLLRDYGKSLYKYSKEGIIILYGPLRDRNLNELYNSNPIETIELLENIIENTDDYKTKWVTHSVIKDLKSNYLGTP